MRHRTTPALITLLSFLLLLCLTLNAATPALAQTFYILDIHPNTDSSTADEITASNAHREGFLAAIHALNDNSGNSALAPRIEIVTVSDPQQTMSAVETVQAALDQWPDLLAVFGPFNVDAVLELVNSNVLSGNDLVCLGLASSAQALRVWSPHLYFFRADPTTEIMAMLRYGVSTLTARRFGFMYIADTNFGDEQLDIVVKALERTPITKEDMAIYVGHDINGDVDEDQLNAFLDKEPQVVMIFGRPGPHTHRFTSRVLTDVRGTNMRLLVPSTAASTVFDAIANLEPCTVTGPGHENNNGTDASTSVPYCRETSGLRDPTIDERIFFTTTNHLGTEDSYSHIRYFQAQVRQFIADGLSTVYSADEPDAFVADDSRREMIVAGWVAGSSTVRAVRDPTWWNVEAAPGYATLGNTWRQRFMNYLFQPSRAYMVGEDFFVGTYGGTCDAALGRVPADGLACECNQGGRSAFVSQLHMSNMTLEPVPEYTFSYSKAHCCVRDAYVLPRPLGLFLMLVTDFFYPTNEPDDAAKAVADAIFEAFADEIEQCLTQSLAYWNGIYTDLTLAAQKTRASSDGAEALAESIFADRLVMTLVGSVLPGTRVEGAFMLNPYFPKPAIADRTASNMIFIFPTFDQQVYMAYKYFAVVTDIAEAEKQAHIILRGVPPANVPAIRSVLLNTTDTFNLRPSQVEEIESGASLREAFAREKLTRKVVFGLESGDAATLAQYLKENPNMSVLLLFEDVMVLYEELHTAFGAVPASVQRRALFATSLPIWSDTSDAARATSPLLAAYQDSLAASGAPSSTPTDDDAPVAKPTPLGLVSWTIVAFIADLADHFTGVITADSLADAVYQTQSFHTQGMSFLNYRRCPDPRTSNSVEDDAEVAAAVNSEVEDMADDASSGDDLQVVDSDTCEPRNYGAANIKLYTFEVLFKPDTYPIYGPITPSMIYTKRTTSSLSNGAIAGIVVGCVVAVAGIVALIVVLCCLCGGGARDNKNAPHTLSDPVTLVFTDIESSTALWASAPEEMPDAVATHHELIRELIARYKCYEVKTIGDSFMIACKEPFAAVQLASDIQTTFLAHDWGTSTIDDCYHAFEFAKEKASAEARAEAAHHRSAATTPRAGAHHAEIDDAPDAITQETEKAYVSPSAHLSPDAYTAVWHGLRVRAGIHTGLSDIRHDEITQGYDYYGETSNMAARTEAVGNGGQVVLTEATWWALSANERASLACTSLGKQCLRGVPFEVEMIQVNAVPGRQFAPLRVEIEAKLPPGVEDGVEADKERQLNASTTASDGDAVVATAEKDGVDTERPQGTAAVAATLIAVLFRPFRGDDKVDGVKPLLERWGLEAPSRPKNVAAESYAQTLVNRLAVKIGSVTDASARLRGARVNVDVGADLDALAQSTRNGLGSSTFAPQGDPRRPTVPTRAEIDADRDTHVQRVQSLSSQTTTVGALTSTHESATRRTPNRGRTKGMSAADKFAGLISVFSSGGRGREEEVAFDGRTATFTETTTASSMTTRLTEESTSRIVVLGGVGGGVGGDDDEMSPIRPDRSARQRHHQYRANLRAPGNTTAGSPRKVSASSLVRSANGMVDSRNLPFQPDSDARREAGATTDVFVLPGGNRSTSHSRGLTSAALAQASLSSQTSPLLGRSDGAPFSPFTASSGTASFSQRDVAPHGESDADEAQRSPAKETDGAAPALALQRIPYPPPPHLRHLREPQLTHNARDDAAPAAALAAATSAAALAALTGADTAAYEGLAVAMASTSAVSTATSSVAASATAMSDDDGDTAHLVVDSPLHFNTIGGSGLAFELSPGSAKSTPKVTFAAAPVPITPLASTAHESTVIAATAEKGNALPDHANSFLTRSMPSVLQPPGSATRPPVVGNPLSPDCL